MAEESGVATAAEPEALVEEEPVAAEAPEAEKSVVEEPVAEESGETMAAEPEAVAEEEPVAAEEPASEESVAEEPMAGESSEVTAAEPEAPAEGEPVAAEAPVAEEAAADEEPTAEEPAAGEATAEESAAAEGPEREEPAPPICAAVEISETERAAALDEIKDFTTLDEFLDFAYDRKSRHQFGPAIVAYEKALAGYQDDSYAPFIVIELGNIYKENGAYSEAIGVYRRALKLPVIQGQSGIEADFSRNIDYLDTVSHILARHDAPNLPFNRIPSGYLEEIESAFADRTTGQPFQH